MPKRQRRRGVPGPPEHEIGPLRMVVRPPLQTLPPVRPVGVPLLEQGDGASLRHRLVPDDDINTYLSFRNLKKVSIFGVSEATTRSLIDNAALVMSADIAKQLGEVLA